MSPLIDDFSYETHGIPNASCGVLKVVNDIFKVTFDVYKVSDGVLRNYHLCVTKKLNGALKGQVEGLSFMEV